MPAYKNKSGKGWFVKFRIYDRQKKVKYITKRGFSTKHDALEFENNYKLTQSGSSSMKFRDFVQLYLDSIRPRLKESTMVMKENIINNRLLPFFGEMKMDAITTADVLKWQNEMLQYLDSKSKRPFARSYLKTLHNQLSAVFNFGIKFYGFKVNPAATVGNMGSDKRLAINFWIPEEYKQFADIIMKYPIAYYCFEVLYWTGIREGELLALTPADIDLDARTIRISKTYHVIKGREVITNPKTLKSNRIVSIPKRLAEELADYMKMIYALAPSERLFPVSKTFLSKKLHEGARKAGVKQIRVHDLRHSHISMLIDMGYSAVAIADRVGHETVTITFRYSHLFPSREQKMIDDINVAMEGEHRDDSKEY